MPFVSANSNAMLAPHQILDFSLSPEDIIAKTTEAIRIANERLDQIGQLPDGECDVERVIEGFARIDSDFRIATSACTFLSSASTDKAVRDASNEAEKLINEYAIEKSMREDLFRVAKAVRANVGDKLEGETKRYLDKLLLGFKRNGLELEPEKRAVLKEKMKRLSDF